MQLDEASTAKDATEAPEKEKKDAFDKQWEEDKTADQVWRSHLWRCPPIVVIVKR